MNLHGALDMDLEGLQQDITAQLMSTRIVTATMQGSLCEAQYIAYMSDVYCYARHSSQVIGQAGARLVLSHPELSQYLFHHAREELGHDKWAESDLWDLKLTPDEIAEIEPSPPCLRMIGLEYLYAAHLNPVGLFGWMFVLESLGGRAGGAIAEGIDKALRLNGKALYFLNGHADADAQHSLDLYRVVKSHVHSKADRRAFDTMARQSAELYCAMLDHAFEAGSQA